MHYISYVSIENFRACQSIEIPLRLYTPLVGQNNTGKSTILEAIRWALKPTGIKSTDFCDPSKPLIVSVKIERNHGSSVE